MLDERVLVTALRLLHPLVLNTFDERFTSKELHAYALFELLNHFTSRNDATAAEISWERSLAQRILSVYRKYLSEFTEHHSIDAGVSRMTSTTTNALGFNTSYREWKRDAELLFVKGDDGFSDAAYLAAFSSFEQVLEQFRHSNTFWSFNLENLTSFLLQKVLSSFHSFCQGYSIECSWSFIHLAIIIKVAGYIAQEIFNSDLNQRYLTESEAKYKYFLTYIFKNTSSVEDTFLAGTSMSHLDTSHLNDTLVDADDDLVGLDDDLLKIKDQLTGLPSKLKIIPIVGMGGMGKTTLARKIYEDHLIVYHFYVRAWIRVSQEYRLRDVLLGLLKSLTLLTDDISEERDEELTGRLYRSLKQRRYLIIMDDMWSTKAWDDVKRLFPNDNNGSRIILTTRLVEVASYANYDNPPHSMNFLSIQDSWRLLCKKVFVIDICPPQLVNVGKQIAEKCQGLPLAIIVVAGYLSKISKTQDSWENVAKRVASLISGTQDQILDILSLSFKYLPQHLKACFLYMGTFPKNSEILVQKLIRLWIAVGFVQPKGPNSLEEEAEKYLEDLVSRSLIMVKARKPSGKLKACNIHDLLWDLTFREVQKQGEYIYGMHRFLLDSYFHIPDERENLMRLTFSFIYFDHDFDLHFQLSSASFKLLRVLDIVFQSFSHFPNVIIQLANLRYLALAISSNLPGSIYNLSNLESLINHHPLAGPILPKEIWKIPNLRHLHIGTCTYLPDPVSTKFDEKGHFSLPSMQTLSTIGSASCTKEVFSRMPNLKELKVHEIGEDSSIDEQLLNFLQNLVYLRELEKLSLYSSVEIDKPRQIPRLDIFPLSLKQLTLRGSHLAWTEMNTLALLPNLQVLKLKKNAFIGPVWEQLCLWGFPQLKFLLLESLDLVHWEASSHHFSKLEYLVLKNCIFLDEIPHGIGDIDMLQLIELDNCSFSAIMSAKRIQKEQLSKGNDNISFRIGKTLHELKLVIFTWAFIHMTSVLKKQSSEHDQL